MEKIVLIPAYKPDKRMIDLVRTLSGMGFTVVIVDDGSGREFRARFEEAEECSLVVRCEKNGGKGTALKRGLAYIKENFVAPYCVITADADGQHRVEDIAGVASLSEKNPGALVLGCRSIDKTMPPKNRWGNISTKIVFFLSTGKYVHDSQTGLRGFSDSAVDFMLNTPGTRYEYEMNVLLRWAGCDLPVAETPIQTVYFDGNSGTHFQAFNDSVRIYREVVYHSLPSFCCFLLDVLLFGLLFYLSPLSLLGANIIARAVTAALQFLFLRYMLNTFCSDKEISLTKYLLLSILLLAGNTLALWGLTAIGIVPVGAKIIVNILFFLIGLVPRRKFIYYSKRS